MKRVRPELPHIFVDDDKWPGYLNLLSLARTLEQEELNPPADAPDAVRELAVCQQKQRQELADWFIAAVSKVLKGFPIEEAFELGPRKYQRAANTTRDVELTGYYFNCISNGMNRAQALSQTCKAFHLQDESAVKRAVKRQQERHNLVLPRASKGKKARASNDLSRPDEG